MDLIVYAGHTLRSSDIPTLVASVSAGRIPSAGRARAVASDPVGWLDGLVAAVEGSGLYPDLQRALERVLRTGNAGQLEVVARLACQRAVVPVPWLVQALMGPQAGRRIETGEALAMAISAGVLRRPEDYDPLLRAAADVGRLRRVLLPAFLIADLAWASELALDAPADVEALKVALRSLPEERQAAAAAQFAVLRPAHAPPTAPLSADVTEPTTGLLPPEQPPVADPSPVPQVSVAALPWRGADGCWYRLPEAFNPRPGAYELRRGLHTLRVDRLSLDGWEIDPETARRARSQQLMALVSLVKASVPGHSGPQDSGSAEPPRLARMRGRLTALMASPSARQLLKSLTSALNDGMGPHPPRPPSAGEG